MRRPSAIGRKNHDRSASQLRHTLIGVCPRQSVFAVFINGRRLCCFFQSIALGRRICPPEGGHVPPKGA